MKDQHEKIKGYRDLSQEEIDLMNKIKEFEKAMGFAYSILVNSPYTDKRWLNIGRTHLEQGFMAVVRSIAQPDTAFSLSDELSEE